VVPTIDEETAIANGSSRRDEHGPLYRLPLKQSYRWSVLPSFWRRPTIRVGLGGAWSGWPLPGRPDADVADLDPRHPENDDPAILEPIELAPCGV